MIELYDDELCSDAYKVRLLLSMLGVTYVTKCVEFYPAREHQSAWFLELSPRGELPLLRDEGKLVEDAQGILEHVARRHDRMSTWYPTGNAVRIGQTAMWLSLADALSKTAGAARLHDAFLYHHIDASTARDGAHELLRVLDEHLWFSERIDAGWLCPGELPTIADVACFPDVMLGPEGGIDISAYYAVGRWADRVKSLPGFIPMPGIFPL